MISVMKMIDCHTFLVLRGALRDKPKERLRGRLTKLTLIQSTPENSNLQGKSKKVRIIESSKKIAGGKVKNSFYCTVNILITSYCRNVLWILKDL